MIRLSVLCLACAVFAVTSCKDDTGGKDDAGPDGGQAEPLPVSYTIFDRILFYDGYAEVVDEPVPEGVIRHRNSLYARKLTEDQLQSVQTTLKIQVIIGAACDNYDRIGSVNLALVPKGSETYDPDQVERLEIGRFITPFMDMNKEPDSVPYEYDMDYLATVLGSEALHAQFDLWLELEVFGVPYAANTEIVGCAGHNDVFYGTLTVDSDSTAEAQEFSVLLPLAMKEAFNNYQDGACDELGETKKTITFSLDQATEDGRLALITSNHGANAGGEEYNRREHFVYFDGDLELEYTPGRDTCEPFRQYNTQANGIYGTAPKSDAQWQAFSNWCPGDVIDTRIIELGAVSAGEHEFVIEVPDAVFNGGEGNFPLSLFFLGK